MTRKPVGPGHLTGSHHHHHHHQAPTLFRQVNDFANIFKSFICTNWIGFPFAFRQSGILLGCIGLALIALVTDHCGHLIITCKRTAVKIALLSNQKYNDPKTTQEELQDIRDAMEKKVMYSDIGKIAIGKPGIVLVEISLIATQIGFCVGYLIFIGTTLESLFKEYNIIIVITGNSSSPNNATVYSKENVSSAPAFPILVLIPMVPLILMAFIRRVRKLGPISVISNVFLLVAFMSVLGYLLSGLHFKVKEMELANWATFPIFFGQVSSAYEGLGTLVPIESSMGKNRHQYPLYLHLSIGIVSCILGGFGLIGYSVYGSNTPQIITENLPPGPLIAVVKVLLCLAVLFSYPLQLFPITEVIDSYLFKDPNELVMDNKGHTTNPEAQQPVNNEDDRVCKKQDSVMTYVNCPPDESTELLTSAAANNKPKKKTNWHKNFLRTVTVLFTGGLAILLKDDFAYVAALYGSVGSSTLGFILPCVFHNVLLKDTNSKFVTAKNYCIILFGVIGGGVGLAVTVLEIVKQFTK